LKSFKSFPERIGKKTMTENHPNLFLVNDQDFEQSVLNSTLPVIVEFTADWCPPCHALAPIYTRLSDAYNGKLRFAKMDIDQNPLVPAQQMVQAAPTLILFVNGKPAGRVVGPYPSRLQQSIESMLAEASVKA
jgi:thioredoxin 1